jgi:hypothetical protein
LESFAAAPSMTYREIESRRNSKFVELRGGSVRHHFVTFLGTSHAGVSVSQLRREAGKLFPWRH